LNLLLNDKGETILDLSGLKKNPKILLPSDAEKLSSQPAGPEKKSRK